MKSIYFTITGTSYYYGHDFIKHGMKVKLEKEPDNKADSEAIKVMMNGIGKIGYVANSTVTVLGESMSAGRLYDKIGDKAYGKVMYALPQGVICELMPTDGSNIQIVVEAMKRYAASKDKNIHKLN